ncbi:benzoate/H(+) symporter BenE family transporter [Cognatishimia activa]|uniref:benzoate/H(+) symporter BenE family transporter n=1 Tax=Cognatishimia activa TaxID=1715691 RepID=UPI00222E58C9|nr:benzoate/H(+) symporter BenE family transporter [Cognatishimia activa]UZD90504.1 benzoate/H(+) symporter BenE family transporter [Cognatishimia activa]
MFGFKLTHVTSGILPALVGYTGSIVIIFAAIEALGATQAQANSWLWALGIGMGLSGVILALRYKMPVLTAWSTPGAALIAVSGEGVPIEQAVAAFLFCAILLIVTGLTGVFERLTKLIPPALASAMLAGILFRFGLGTFEALEEAPLLVLTMLATWLAGRLWFPQLTIAVVLLVGAGFCAVTGMYNPNVEVTLALAKPVFVIPELNWSVIIGLGLPLYIVTMSSQNMPGVVVLKSAGYEPPVSGTLTVTGITSLLLAPFGGYAFNFAAITAALCAGPETDPDPGQRYKAVLVSGSVNILAGLFGATIISLFLIAPEALVLAIAGIALIGTITSSLAAAMTDAQDRDAALVTFMMVVSGISFFNIGAPVWGLLLGLVVKAVLDRRKK